MTSRPAGRNNGLPPDISPDELREFLEADLLEVDADPDFKEKLRLKLWNMVRRRHQAGLSDRES